MGDGDGWLPVLVLVLGATGSAAVCGLGLGGGLKSVKFGLRLRPGRAGPSC
jgi:hypothetical protein